MFKRIDHVVIAVDNLEETAALYAEKFGLQATPAEEVPALGLRQVKLEVGNAYVELAQPTDATGPLARFLKERGEGLYLIAVEVHDLGATVRALREKGARLIGDENLEDPGPHRVFIHPKTARGALIMLQE